MGGTSSIIDQVYPGFVFHARTFRAITRERPPSGPELWGGPNAPVGARSDTSMSRQHVCSFDLQRLGRSQHFFRPYKTTMIIIVIPFAAAEPPNCFMNSPFCCSIASAFLVDRLLLFNGQRGVRKLVKVQSDVPPVTEHRG